MLFNIAFYAQDLNQASLIKRSLARFRTCPVTIRLFGSLHKLYHQIITTPAHLYLLQMEHKADLP